jgi:drug/metabolite transporter (DMT)-like permease
VAFKNCLDIDTNCIAEGPNEQHEHDRGHSHNGRVQHYVCLGGSADFCFRQLDRPYAFRAWQGASYRWAQRHQLLQCSLRWESVRLSDPDALYRRHWTRENLNALTLSDWLSLGFLAILTGAILPSVIFYALLNTTVINVVLVGRIEPFVLLAPSPFFLKEKTNKWAVIGASICLAGVVTSFVLEGLNSGFSVGRGETVAALGAVLAAVGIIVSKVRLRSIPLGNFSVIRTGFGDVFFFIFAIYLFGIDQFEHAFSPFLWQLMVFYGAVIVGGGQYFWFTGIKNAPKSDVSLASSFTPIAAAGFAFLLLGERPGSSATVYHGRSLSVACRQPRLCRPSVGSTSRAFDHPPF